ncbi:MAG: DNA gyrase inhibitor YacG [Bauldia sp.]|nr:DNA gyrase inhibitor YacG [Bauldia sp.]
MTKKPPATNDAVVPLRPTRPCPICGKPSDRTYYPFCSKRCADRDLHGWLSGAYAIPAVEAEREDEDERGD